MVPLRPVLAVLVIAGLLLSGCASSNSSSSSTDPASAVNTLDLKATQDTGVIRGVVVDIGVRPIQNVMVAATGAGKTFTTNTTDTGAFGLQGVPPGTYFLKAKKAGFHDTQTSVEVVAGVSDPPAVRITMDANLVTKPYWRAIVNKGYIECSVTAVFYGVAACSVVGPIKDATGEQFLFTNSVDKVPTAMQSEMVWSDTQQLGHEMEVVWSYGCSTNGGLLCDPASAGGPSPLLLQGNATNIKALFTDGGNRTDFIIRVFNKSLGQTDPPPGTTQGVCVPTLVLGTPCARRGVGLTLEQTYDIYTHVFYGYTPPQDWRFTSNKPVPEPPK